MWTESPAFTITAQNITVTAPTAGAVWKIGVQQTITYTDNIADDVTIDLYKTGAWLETIINQTPSAGTYNYTPPTYLANGTDYKIRISSIANLSLYGESGIFSINNYLAPTATTLAATAVGNTTATLHGTVNANNVSTSVTFEYGTTTSYGQSINATPATVTGNAVTNVSALLTGLTANTIYHYRVKAVSAGGTTLGNDFTFHTTLVDMVAVTGGSFQMGCGTGSGSCNSGETPVHTVTLSSFYMGKYEVTQQQYLSVMGSNPSYFTGDLSRPVEQVTWYNCVQFCNSLSALEGLANYYNINGTTITVNATANGYRLPTEAEWEYAARGGASYTDYFMYAGGNDVNTVAWYTSNSGNTTHAVGTKTANQLGIYDLSGNVWEWCWDWYDGSYYSSSPASNPQGPATGSARVLRGGAWYYIATGCRAAYRISGAPTYSYYGLGFRVVRTF